LGAATGSAVAGGQPGTGVAAFTAAADNSAVTSWPTITRNDGAFAASAALTARAKQTNGVATGTAGASCVYRRLSAKAPVSAVAQQQSTVATRPAGTSDRTYAADLRPAMTAGAAAADQPGVAATTTRLAAGAEAAVTAGAEQHAAESPIATDVPTPAASSIAAITPDSVQQAAVAAAATCAGRARAAGFDVSAGAPGTAVAE
jgi:hypothetical protein